MMLYNLIKYKPGLLHSLMLLLLFVTGALINFGCSTYSFTGASVPAHLKTIAIPIADDKSGGYTGNKGTTNG
jgi:hypothetical protein